MMRMLRLVKERASSVLGALRREPRGEEDISPVVPVLEDSNDQPKELDYESRLAKEVEYFRSIENVHNLPDIFHYWSNKYLVPKYQQFGFSNPTEFFLKYMTQVCIRSPNRDHWFLSIGAGNCEFEVELAQKLLGAGIENFRFESLDLNAFMLERGKALAQERSVAHMFKFTEKDINSWTPEHSFTVVMALQSLHHILELELLFDKIHAILEPDGFFLTDDIIGRNGHMRWPEALEIVNQFWDELPERYKYNHQLKRLEIQYDNWDCSTEGFEGIRAQDILPLLIERFHFELFVGFANVIDIFIDRNFGHNFDPNSKSDLEFIDRVHFADEEAIEKGLIKPTHMTAALVKSPPLQARTHKHLTPQYCVRLPNK